MKLSPNIRENIVVTKSVAQSWDNARADGLNEGGSQICREVVGRETN